jgi:hypothetical protein
MLDVVAALDRVWHRRDELLAFLALCAHFSSRYF